MTDEERAKLGAIADAASALAYTATNLARDSTATLAHLEPAWQRLLALRWQGMDSAPRDRPILLYGKLRPHPDNEQLYSGWRCRALGYWDDVDEDWRPVGSPWEGPWLEPTAWMPLPPAHGQ